MLSSRLLRKTKTLGVLALTTWQAGCSLNGYGFLVDQQNRFLPGAKIKSTTALGFHIYTHHGLGFQLGQFQREIVYPRNNLEDQYCLHHLNTDFYASLHTVPYSENDYIGEASRQDIRRAGLGIGLDRSRIQLTLGLSHTQRSRFNLDNNSTFWYFSANTEQNSYACGAIYNN